MGGLVAGERQGPAALELELEPLTLAANRQARVRAVWLGPFGAVWLTDGLLRRWRYDPDAVHDVSPASRYWGWRGVNLNGWIALLAGVAVCVLTVNAPILDGPVSRALDGADFTWTLGPLVSALVYWLLVGVKPLTAGPAP